MWESGAVDDDTPYPFDVVTQIAKVKPEDVIASAVRAGLRHAQDVSRLMYAATTPQVVHRLAKSALRIGGDQAAVARQDRVTFLQHVGLAPVPGARPSVVVNTQATASAKAAAAASSDPGVPSFAEDMGSLQPTRTALQQRLAEAIDVDPLRDAVPEAVGVDRV